MLTLDSVLNTCHQLQQRRGGKRKETKISIPALNICRIWGCRNFLSFDCDSVRFWPFWWASSPWSSSLQEGLVCWALHFHPCLDKGMEILLDHSQQNVPNLFITLEFFALQMAWKHALGSLPRMAIFVECWDLPSFDYGLCGEKYLADRAPIWTWATGTLLKSGGILTVVNTFFKAVWQTLGYLRRELSRIANHDVQMGKMLERWPSC